MPVPAIQKNTEPEGNQSEQMEDEPDEVLDEDGTEESRRIE